MFLLHHLFVIFSDFRRHFCWIVYWFVVIYILFFPSGLVSLLVRMLLIVLLSFLLVLGFRCQCSHDWKNRCTAHHHIVQPVREVLLSYSWLASICMHVVFISRSSPTASALRGDELGRVNRIRPMKTATLLEPGTFRTYLSRARGSLLPRR